MISCVNGWLSVWCFRTETSVFLAGTCVGFVQALVTCPLEVVKTRIYFNHSVQPATAHKLWINKELQSASYKFTHEIDAIRYYSFAPQHLSLNIIHTHPHTHTFTNLHPSPKVPVCQSRDPVFLLWPWGVNVAIVFMEWCLFRFNQTCPRIGEESASGMRWSERAHPCVIHCACVSWGNNICRCTKAMKRMTRLLLCAVSSWMCPRTTRAHLHT